MTRTARCVLGLRVICAAPSHPTDLPATPTDNTQFEETTKLRVTCWGCVFCALRASTHEPTPLTTPTDITQFEEKSTRYLLELRVHCCPTSQHTAPATPTDNTQLGENDGQRVMCWTCVFCALRVQTPTSYLELSIISCILRSFFVHANSGSLRYEIAYPFALVKHFRANGIMLSASPRNP